MRTLHWWVEDLLPDSGAPLRAAAQAAGMDATRFDDEWWHSDRFPAVGPDDRVLFHGSLGNAARLRAERPDLSPGAFCDARGLAFHAWAPALADVLLSPRWLRSTVADFVADPQAVADRLDTAGRVFVRPDSPLKPFSGRVLPLSGLTPAHLDCGFYYDDPALPIIVAPVNAVGPEWRVVVVEGRPIAWSGYAADGRTPRPGAPAPALTAWAQEVAARLPALGTDPVLVLDLVETPQGPRLVELNPFSGADLYACDRDAIVRAVHALLA